MRLREKDKQDVIVCKSEGFDDDVYRWGESYDIRAAIYPNNRSIDAKIYGDRIWETKLLLYDGDRVKLDVGMGVSLGGGVPAWRIASVEHWDHQTSVLELIPEGRRGDAD